MPESGTESVTKEPSLCHSVTMSIKRYFEQNHSALEVLIFKGSKIISIIREDTESYVFIRNFMMKY